MIRLLAIVLTLAGAGCGDTSWTFADLPGRWNNEITGESIVISKSGYVWLSSVGEAIIENSNGVGGSHIILKSSSGVKCYYYVVFIKSADSRKMEWNTRHTSKVNPPPCPNHIGLISDNSR
jgi:hypothetical protein